MSIQKLLKSWSLPDRTTERAQITLRLNADLYAKLHALKEVYKTRPVNDLINDIIKTALDEIVDALPVYEVTSADIDPDLSQYPELTWLPEDIGTKYGPRIHFDIAYARILNEKANNESDASVLS